MPHRKEDGSNGVTRIATKVSAIVGAVLAILALGGVLGGWAMAAVNRRIEIRASALEQRLGKFEVAQQATNETLAEIMCVLVAQPSPERVRMMDRLRAKYVIGVQR